MNFNMSIILSVLYEVFGNFFDIDVYKYHTIIKI